MSWVPTGTAAWRLATLEKNVGDATQYTTEQSEEFKAMYGPIDALFTEMKMRLEQIPTTEQVATAGEAWPVAVAWVVGTTLWLYYRKNLMSLVIVHAGSNLSILLFVVFGSGKWLDAEGFPIDLWFFV